MIALCTFILWHGAWCLKMGSGNSSYISIFALFFSKNV